MIVCSCNVFSDRDVRLAIDSAPARPATANQVYGCLGCSPQCGRCDRIIFLEGFPNMQVLDPLHIGQNVKEILDCDLKAEIDARALYQEAATYCASVKDYVSRDLFEELMADEEHHIDFLESQLDLVSQLGVQLYAQHHIGKLDDE